MYSEISDYNHKGMLFKDLYLVIKFPKLCKVNIVYNRLTGGVILLIVNCVIIVNT